MTIMGPDDPARLAAWRRARRLAARANHPDLGGDERDYLAAIAAVDRRFGVASHQSGAPAREPSRRGLRLMGRRPRRRLVRAIRQRLPRRFPGSRRYAEL